ncbi:MAG: DUF2845 domain-containing protein [Burkholderiaceae bacterium]
MTALSRTLIAAATAGLALGVHAESLRCNGSSASEGDSRLSVLYKCGEPLLKDSRCAQVVVAATGQPVPDAFVGTAVACQPVEEWVYDRGPGNLLATVRFKAGVVQQIIYGHAPP